MLQHNSNTRKYKEKWDFYSEENHKTDLEMIIIQTCTAVKRFYHWIEREDLISRVRYRCQTFISNIYP